MHKYLILGVFIISIFSVNSNADEMYMTDSVGTKIVITDEYCTIQQSLKMLLVNRAYAIDKDGKKFEGCWSGGDMTDAPPSNSQMRVAPVVNISFGNGIQAFLLEWFRPEASHKFPLKGETWL